MLSWMVSSNAQSAVTFENVASAIGLTFRHINGASPEKYLVETMGSGAALLDYDDDGWIDLFVVDGGSIAAEASGPAAPKPTKARAPPALSQRGSGVFKDVTASSGIVHREYGMGACAGDVDGDGRIDLYITNYGPNALYRNAGNGRVHRHHPHGQSRAGWVEHQLRVRGRGPRWRSGSVRRELSRRAEEQESVLRRPATPHSRVLPPAQLHRPAERALSQRRQGRVHRRQRRGRDRQARRQRSRSRRGRLRR